MSLHRNFLTVFVLLALGLVSTAVGQQPSAADFFRPQPGNLAGAPRAGFQTPAPLTNPPANLNAPAVYTASTLFQGSSQGFDPFRPNNNQPFPFFSSGGQSQPIQVLPPPAGMQFPQGPPPQYNQQAIGQPFFQNQGGAGAWPNSNSAWPSQMWARLRGEWIPRLIERPRFRHTWVSGSLPPGNELDINDAEIATTMTFPRFLGGAQPLRVSPGFIFHFWNGPDAATGFELPSRAYSVFLSGNHFTDPRRPAGLETNFTVGLYSDFDNFSTDAVRLTGLVVSWWRINSYTTAKIGVEYFDRIDLKLLPAFGIFLNPNSDLRLDLFFPRPKIAQRIPNVRNLEVWIYSGGEYGGGSWAIERSGPMDDQVDINDVRAFIGLEWVGPKRVTGFFEAGYVFNREVLFKSDPSTVLDLNDSIMLRTGFAF